VQQQKLQQLQQEQLQQAMQSTAAEPRWLRMRGCSEAKEDSRIRVERKSPELLNVESSPQTNKCNNKRQLKCI